jgi:hypothetical protein
MATTAHACAPEPTKPVDLSRFMGRWYEILRTPNKDERSCFAPSEDGRAMAALRFRSALSAIAAALAYLEEVSLPSKTI